MEKEQLVWVKWYAWYPVLLEDDKGWAWLETVEYAIDPEFYERTRFYFSDAMFVPIKCFYRRIENK